MKNALLAYFDNIIKNRFWQADGNFGGRVFHLRNFYDNISDMKDDLSKFSRSSRLTAKQIYKAWFDPKSKLRGNIHFARRTPGKIGKIAVACGKTENIKEQN